jgi:Ca2+-binding EF-hand superfamily protein
MPSRDERKYLDNPWRDKEAAERRKLQDVELTRLVHKAYRLQHSRPFTAELGQFNDEAAVQISGGSQTKSIKGPFDFFERKPPKRDYLQDLVSGRLATVKEKTASNDDPASPTSINDEGAFFLTTLKESSKRTRGYDCPGSSPLATMILRRTLDEDLAKWSSDSSSAGTRTPRHDQIAFAEYSSVGEDEVGRAAALDGALEKPGGSRRRHGGLEFRANPLPPLLHVRPVSVELLTRDEKLMVISRQSAERRRHVREVQTFAKVAQREKEELVLADIKKKKDKAEWNLHHKNWKTRQEKILTVVTLALISTKMRKIQVFKVFWRIRHGSAISVQNLIRKFLWRCRISYLRHVRRILSHVSWRAKMWLCCARRRVCAGLVRSFLCDFQNKYLGYVIMTFRWKMLKLQRCIRDFLACKAARIVVLKKLWAREGKIWLDSRIEEKRLAIIARQQRRIEPGTLEFDIHKRNKKLKAVVPRVLHATHRLEALNHLHQSEKTRNAKMMHIKRSVEKKARHAVRRMKVADEFAPELSKAAEGLLLTWFLETERNLFCASIIHARLEKAKRDSVINLEDAQNLLVGQQRGQQNDIAKPTFLLYTTLGGSPTDPHNPELRSLFERVGDDRDALFRELRQEKRMKRIIKSMCLQTHKKSAYADRNEAWEHEAEAADSTFAEFLKPESPMSPVPMGRRRSIGSNGSLGSVGSGAASPQSQRSWRGARGSKGPFFPDNVPSSQAQAQAPRAASKLDHHLAESFDVRISEVLELREIFELVDTDRGGSIDAEELEKLLGMLGNRKDRSEVEGFITEVLEEASPGHLRGATQSEPELGFAEFATFLLKKKHVVYTTESVIRAFRNLRPQYDPSKSSGHISRDTIMEILTKYGAGKLSKNDAHRLVNESEVFPLSSPDQFDYEDYVSTMMMHAVENDDFSGVSHGTWMSYELMKKEREQLSATEDNGSLVSAGVR